MPATVTSLLEVSRTATNPLLLGMAKELVTTDQLAALIPMQVDAVDTFSYVREGSAPSAGFIDDATAVVAASTGEDDVVRVPVRRIAGDIVMDSLAEDLNPSSRGRQVLKKTKAVWDLVKKTLITGGNTTGHVLATTAAPFTALTAISYGPGLESNRFGPGDIRYTNAGTTWEFRAPGDPGFGDPVTVAASTNNVVLRSFNRSKYIVVNINAAAATANGTSSIAFASSNNEFDGVNRLCARDMMFSSSGTDGDVFSFDTLDLLMDKVKVRNNLAYFMNGTLVRRYLAVQRLLGGVNPEHIQLPGYGGPTLAYRGIPILTNDNIPSTEIKGARSNLSSVYLASLDVDEGLYLGVAGTGAQADDLSDPRRTVTYGWRIEDVGPLEGVARRAVRVQWYGAACLRSSRALARATEIQTTP